MGLAGPATQNRDAPAFRNLDAIFLVLDLSPSVIRGGGLADAKSAASRLIDRHGTRPVALIVFSGEAFLASVPTVEPETLQSAIAVIDAETMPVAGTRPDRALALVGRTMTETGTDLADVVLISDGGGVGPEARHEARLLRAAGAEVSAVFVPQRGPASYGLPPPDRAALVALVAEGEGLLADGVELDALEAFLFNRADRVTDDRSRRALLYADHGRWLMLGVCAALLPVFRRRVAV